MEISVVLFPPTFPKQICNLPMFVCYSITNTAFKEALKRIESSPECGGLPMISFLILPMQRVTRLPLLMDVRNTRTHIYLMSYYSQVGPKFLFLSTFMQTICQKTIKQTTEYYAARWALKAISRVRQTFLSFIYIHWKLD